jgi:hypothetical protein
LDTTCRTPILCQRGLIGSEIASLLVDSVQVSVGGLTLPPLSSGQSSRISDF